MKTKVVEYIAGEALNEINEALGEVLNMRNNYPDIFLNHHEGIGLDLAVLKEKIEKADQLIRLLTVYD